MPAENPHTTVETGKNPAQIVAMAHASGQVLLADIRPGEEGQFPNNADTHDLAIAEDFRRDMEAKGFVRVTNEPSRMPDGRRSIVGGLQRKLGAANVVTGPAISAAGDRRLTGYRSVYAEGSLFSANKKEHSDKLWAREDNLNRLTGVSQSRARAARTGRRTRR